MSHEIKGKLKVVVYTICKNEEQFVDRWVDSMQEADEIVVLDTGSTDNTVARLKARGVQVEVGVFKPWRFDLPRNTSLQLVSADTDICVCTDLDEILTPGWRTALEEVWVPGVTKGVKYLYTWDHNPDGSPGTTFWYEKIHARDGYRWVKPVHEILQCSLPEKDKIWVHCQAFQLRHWPDNTKSRSSYLPLLEIAVKEEPEDDRNSHYYGRELMYYSQYDAAITELVRHLSLPRSRWMAERAASMKFISVCFMRKGDLLHAREWALKACAEDPNARETWLQLAKVCKAEQDWYGVIFAVSKVLDIKVRPDHYINEPEAWSTLPNQLWQEAQICISTVNVV